MNAWEEITLDDIADLTVGFVGKTATHYVDKGVRFLRSLNVTPFRINFNDAKYIDDEFHNKIRKSELKTGDVVIVRTGKPGACAVIPEKTEEWNCSDLVVIKPNHKKINATYLAAFINLAYGVINAHVVGAVQQHFNVGSAKKLKIKLPPIEIQEKIGFFIDNINDKIFINEKINDNLYAQMRTLTKQWITENSSDYELLPLAKIASINPDTYSLKEEWEYVNYLDTSSITDGYIAEIQHITLSTEKLPSRARRKIAPNDVVFSTVRPNQRHFGILSEPMPNMLGSTGFAVIRSNNPLVCNELIYLCLTENEFIEKMQQLAEQSTSTFPSIKPSDLGVCEIPCPKDDASKSFFEMLKSMFALIAENQRENISLATTRDTLLPKLMSGELDVSSIQI